MSAGHHDVCIVGGGVVGSAAAYFLAADPEFDGSVLVLEPDPSYQRGATARSVGSIRQQFSTPVNIAISQFAVRFLRNIEQYLAVDGDVPAIGFHEGGYMFLADEEGLEARRMEYATAVGNGADVAWLTPAELSARFPWLDTVGLAGGTLGLSGEGWLDPYGLLQAFRRKARALGVEYLDRAVTGLQLGSAGIDAVDLDDGSRIGCGWVINTAGIRAPDIARMAGIEVPVRPRKRFVYVFDCRESVPGLPLTILPQGIYVRPESGQFITGFSPPPEEDTDCDDLEVEWSHFEEWMWPALAERIPAFEAIRLINAWAGHYDVNTFDANAVLGAHPDCRNHLIACGFTGHGLQQAPAVGRGLAECVIHGDWQTLDLSPLGFARLYSGEPLVEGKVV